MDILILYTYTRDLKLFYTIQDIYNNSNISMGTGLKCRRDDRETGNRIDGFNL